MATKVHFSVRPRYTPGSSAQVSERIANQLVEEELGAYRRALTGIYGKEEASRAERLGLMGIVERLTERNSEGWEVHDLITKATYFRPAKDYDHKKLTQLRVKYDLEIIPRNYKGNR